MSTHFLYGSEFTVWINDQSIRDFLFFAIKKPAEKTSHCFYLNGSFSYGRIRLYKIGYCPTQHSKMNLISGVIPYMECIILHAITQEGQGSVKVPQLHR
jgi:hypothetical protein